MASSPAGRVTRPAGFMDTMLRTQPIVYREPQSANAPMRQSDSLTMSLGCAYAALVMPQRYVLAGKASTAAMAAVHCRPSTTVSPERLIPFATHQPRRHQVHM